MTTKVICDKCGKVEAVTDDEFMVKKAVKVVIDKKLYELCPDCFVGYNEIKRYWHNKEMIDLQAWMNR